MRITFDPAKDRKNVAERGLSFPLAEDLEWSTAVAVEDTRRDYGETRLRVLALLGKRLHAVVVTARSEELGSSVCEKQIAKRKDYMNKVEKPNPERLDEENPEWTLLDIAQARPAVELLAKHIGAKSTDELVRRTRGRPPKEERKVDQTLRIDPDVLDAYRQEGKGWQTHINEVLREHMPKRQK